MSEQRSSFASKLGFVLAAAGSAVGLGNLWRFPYLTAKYGGGMFILIYIILALTFGFSLMVAEIALGRKTRSSAITAYKNLSEKWSFLGYISALVPIIITPYYCVIGGWILKYLFSYITLPTTADVAAISFGGFIGAPVEPLLWFLLFLGLTILVIIVGVEQGIEKISKILMPLLVIIVLFVAIYACTLPGAKEGLKYLFYPNVKDFTPTTILRAMTQLFFSLSLAMCIMITYGSYMKKDNNIETCVWQIEAFDTGIAILAAVAIIPAIYACGNPSEDLTAGAGLIFVILPKLFNTMAIGKVIAILFFVLVFFAAITSSISLYEAVVSIFCDKKNIKRGTSIVITLIICLVIGALSSLGNGPLAHIQIIKGQDFLTFFDFISNNVIMPIVALGTCIFVGWVIKPQVIIDEVQLSSKFTLKTLFTIIIKYVAPILITIILVTSILEGLGVLSFG